MSKSSHSMVVSCLLSLALLMGCTEQVATPAEMKVETEADSGINIAWIEKYATYEQDAAGELHQTDSIFLAEIGYTDTAAIALYTAEVFRSGDDEALATYGPDDLLSTTNGFIYSRKTQSFDSLPELEELHAQSATYHWKITGPDGVSLLPPVGIGGPEGVTETPVVSPLIVEQSGESISGPTLSLVDPTTDVTFRWQPFIEGGELGDSGWADLHFLLVDNCHGEYVYSGGAPGGEKDILLDYSVTSDVMPASFMEPGMDYVVFLSRVNFRDASLVGITQQLTANSYAVELPFRTAGETMQGRECPDPHLITDYRFSRKSEEGAGMVTWPTVLEIESRNR